jgi:hypothetical protein
LLWWRFLAAIGVPWSKATRVEARDFARWTQIADKPPRTHWRHRDGKSTAASAKRAKASPKAAAGSVNPVTGKAKPGKGYAPSTRGHAETVMRAFYDFQLEAGSGPIINPFPLDRSRRASRANAHHNPMEPFKHERKGRYPAAPPATRIRQSVQENPQVTAAFGVQATDQASGRRWRDPSRGRHRRLSGRHRFGPGGEMADCRGGGAP